MRVAVLGHRGMLGRRVMEEFPAALTFDERFTGGPADPLLRAVRDARPDVIVNCIGTTKGRNLWAVNVELPQELDYIAPLIHPSTDHYMDDTPYAISKWAGEAGTVIRCAIVDPDGGMLLRARKRDTVGELRREWNGITARWWARIARDAIEGRIGKDLIIPGSPTISHYSLLETARRVFGWGTTTIPNDARAWAASAPNVSCPPIEEQLAEYV